MVQHSVLRGWSTPPQKPTTLKPSCLIVWCWFYCVWVQMCICHSENYVHWDSFIILFEKLVMLPSSAAGDRAKHLLVNYLTKPTDSSHFYIFTHGTYFSLCFTKWVNLHLHGVFTLSSQDWSKIHSFILIRPIPVFNWSFHLITRSLTLIIKNYHHCIVCCE